MIFGEDMVKGGKGEGLRAVHKKSQVITINMQIVVSRISWITGHWPVVIPLMGSCDIWNLGHRCPLNGQLDMAGCLREGSTTLFVRALSLSISILDSIHKLDSILKAPERNF